MFTFPGTVMGSSSIYPASPYPPLLYSQSGLQDSNGLFYYLGTNYGTVSWSNPNTGGLVNIYTSGTPGTGTVSNLVDRDVSSATQCVSANTANNYFAFELPKYFILVGYLLRNRNASVGLIRNWTIDGSVNPFASASWVNIATYTSNTTLTTALQFAYFTVPVNTNKYTTFRIYQTGTNSSGTNALGLTEIELYGYLYDTY